MTKKQDRAVAIEAEQEEIDAARLEAERLEAEAAAERERQAEAERLEAEAAAERERQAEAERLEAEAAAEREVETRRAEDYRQRMVFDQAVELFRRGLTNHHEAHGHFTPTARDHWHETEIDLPDDDYIDPHDGWRFTVKGKRLIEARQIPADELERIRAA